MKIVESFAGRWMSLEPIENFLILAGRLVFHGIERNSWRHTNSPGRRQSIVLLLPVTSLSHCSGLCK